MIKENFCYSLSELIDRVQKPCLTFGNTNYWLNQSTEPRKWNNNYTLTRGLQELQSPPAVSGDVFDLVNEINFEFNNQSTRPVRRRKHHLDYGDEINIDDYLSNNLDCWSKSVVEHANSNIYNIAVNIGINSKQKPSELFWRGAGLVAIVDLLTQQGKSVNVDAFVNIQNYIEKKRDTKATLKVNIKRSDMPLDIGVLALVASEVGFARAILYPSLFVLSEHEVSETLGQPIEIDRETAKDYDLVLDKELTSKATVLKVLKGLK